MDIGDIRKAYQGRMPGVIGRHQDYAVLVPFCSLHTHDDDSDDSNNRDKDSSDLSLLYEVRAAGIMQPGEICFPGGHVEDGETPEECAVRETCEELGITPDDIDVICQGDTLYGSGSFTLYTFIGEIRPGEHGNQTSDVLSMLAPDSKEVSEVFTVPVKVLMTVEPDHYNERLKPEIAADFPYEKVGIDRNYPWRTSDHDIPVYDIDGRIIWGMTARITERVIETLK